MSSEKRYDGPGHEGCGDHGCVIHKPEGQGSNGGCRCKPSVLRAYIHHLKAKNSSKAERIAELEGALQWIKKRCNPEHALTELDRPHRHHVECVHDAGARARAALKGDTDE